MKRRDFITRRGGRMAARGARAPFDCSSGSPFVIERRLNLDRLVDVNLNYWHGATHRLFLRIFLSFGPR
jgi:hypothetical protein